MPRTGSSPVAELIRLLSWHRRKLAVLAAMGATAAGIAAATPPSAPTVTVVVAGRELSGGRQLTGSDVAVRNLPTSAVPEGAIVAPGSVIGRTLVAPMTRGSVLTSLSVLGGRTAVAEGMVIAPVRISDAAVIGLLRVGDRVDIVAADAESGKEARVIAQKVRVVTIPRSSTSGSGLDPGATDPPSLVLVEVSSYQAIALAEAAAGNQLSLLLS